TGSIGGHIINKVLITRIPKLMRFPWLKEKGVARFHFGYFVLVAHAAAARNHQVKLLFSRVRVIGTKEFAFVNSDQSEIEWMSLRQIKGLGLTPKGNRDVLDHGDKFPLR